MARRAKKWTQTEIPGASLDAFVPDVTVVPTETETPATTRARAGRAADRHGKALEAWTKGQLDAAVLADVLVWFTKIETPVAQKRVWNPATCQWAWKLVWGAKAHADFVGCTRTGYAVAVECKSVEGARLPLASIARQQVHHLDQVSGAGGIALLVVEFRTEGKATRTLRRYAIPWVYVPWQKARTALSVAESDVAKWRVKAGEVFERLRGR